MKQPRVRIFAGPNGSGKSTFYNKVVEFLGKDINEEFVEELSGKRLGIYVNADDIAKNRNLDLRQYEINITQTEWENYCQSDEITSWSKKLIGEIFSERLSFVQIKDNIISYPEDDGYLPAIIAQLIREKLISTRRSFCFETVFSDTSKLELMLKCREMGYKVYLYFVCTVDVQYNIDRVKKRVNQGGHNVSEEKIIKRYSKSLENLEKAVFASDRAFFYDSTFSPKPFFGAINRLESQEYEWVGEFPSEIPNWLDKYLFNKTQ